jgi:hypothetical protein
VCCEDVIDVFSDSDWPAFLASVEIPDSTDSRFGSAIHYYSAPKLPVYIDYAAQKMSLPDGRKVAIQVLERNFRKKFEVHEAGGYSGDSSLPGPSTVRTVDCVLKNLKEARQRALDLASRGLSDIQTNVCMDAQVQKGLETLGIDILDVLVNVVKSKAICIAQGNECKLRHRDVVVAYKCRKCRDAMSAAVQYLGLVLSIRQHDLTRGDDRFLAIGYAGNIVTSLTTFGNEYNIHPEAVEALMGDNKLEDFAQCENTHHDKAAS